MARLFALVVAFLFVLPAAALAQTPSLQWKLDSYTGNPTVPDGNSTTPDSSPNNLTGTATGIQPISTGRFGGAARLSPFYNSGAGTGVRRPEAAALDTPNLTTVIWVRKDGAPTGTKPIVSYNDNCAPTGWKLRSVEGDVSFTAVAQNGTVTSPVIPSASLWDGGWHGIAVTYDGTTARIFLDGAQVGAGTAGQGPLQYPAFEAQGPTIGVTYSGGCPDFVALDADDFRIYGSALTAAQAEYLTNPFHVVSPSLPVAAVPAPELAARYPLDQIDDQGPDQIRGARDTSGLGNHGRDVSALLVGNSAFGSNYNLDGSADGFRVPFSSLLEPQELTVSAWVRRPTGSGSAGAHKTIVGKSTLGCDHAYALDTGDNGGVGFTVRQASGATQLKTPEIAPAQIWDGAWHAVAGTVRAGTVTLWLDGYPVGTTAITGNIDYGSQRALHVGRNPACASRDYAGDVDDVRVYRRGLKAFELQHLHFRDGSGGAPRELPAPVDPDLRLRYDFDRAGQSQVDGSPNELNGTFVDTQATQGRFGGALRFPQDGGSNPPRGGPPNSTQLEPANTVTLSTWIRGTAVASDRHVVTYSGVDCTQAPGYGLTTTATGALRFSVSTNAGLQTVDIDPADVFDGRWHAVTGTYDGRASVYLDGARVAESPENPAGGGPINYPVSTRGLRFGYLTGNNCNVPNAVADLDEVRVYGSALSPAQVAYLARKYHRRPPASTVPGGDPGGAGLVAQYHLDAVYPGGVVQDSSDQDRPGTGTGTVGAGRFGNALTDPRVVVPDAAGLRPGVFTAMAWVKRNGATGATKTIVSSNATACTGHTWAFDTGANGGLRFYVNTTPGPALVATTSLRPTTIWDDRWHAVAATYDGSDVTLWLDGKAVQLVDGPNGSLPDYAGHAAKGLGIGRSPAASCASQDFSGQVDEVRLYDRVLAPLEIRYLQARDAQAPRALPADDEQPADPTNPPPAEPEPDLQLKWHLDDFFSDGTTPDASGNGLDGIATDTAQPIGGGRFGGAVTVLGEGSVVRTPPPVGEGPPESNDEELRPQNVTLFAWVRADAAPATGQWIAGYETCNATGSYGFATTGAGLRFVTRRGWTQNVPNSAVFDGQWHAIAGIYDGQRMRMFVDGVQAGAAVTFPSSAPLTYGTGIAAFNAGGSGCGDTFSGDVDEVRVYDRALTPRELRWVQDASATTPPLLPVPSVPPGGLLVRYHLDEVVPPTGVPDHTPDSSPNLFHGANFNRFDLAAGRWGNAYDLDFDINVNPPPSGFAARASGAPTLLEPDSLTAMAWVRSTKPKGRATMIAKGTLEAGANPGCDHAYALTTSPAGRLRFTVTVLGANGTHQRLDLDVDADTTLDLFDGDWHAVAGTYGDGRMVLYHDGMQIAAMALDPALDGIDYQSYTQFKDLAVGAGRGNCGFNEVWPGQIDEARVYAGALTPEQIGYLQRDEHRTPPDLPVPANPDLSARPVLTGVPKVGNTLTCTPGTYTGGAITNRAYLWEFGPRSTRKQNSPAWKPIDGAPNTATYTLLPTDAPSRVRCREIASNAGGTAEGLSGSFRVDFDKPVPKSAPTIPGPQVVNTVTAGTAGAPSAPTTLECQTPEWDHGPDPLKYYWTRAGVRIPGADKSTYTLTRTRIGGERVNDDGDGGHLITCVVEGYNDVGFDNTLPAPLKFAIDGPPLPDQRPGMTHVNWNEPNPLKWVFECGEGSFLDDPAAVGVPDWGYTYQWLRNDNVIAGETGKRYTVTADTLGRDLQCASAVRNPSGGTEGGFNQSAKTFVALPQGNSAGRLTTAFRNNRYDPMNLMAVSDRYRDTSARVFRTLQERAIFDEKKACLGTAQKPGSQVAKWSETGPLFKKSDIKEGKYPNASAITLNEVDLCRMLLSHTAAELRPVDQGGSLEYFPSEVRWRPLRGQPDNDCLISYRNEFDAPAACPYISVPIQPVNPESAPLLPADQQTLLEADTPVRVLWDVDGDNRTDISCPGSSPVIRGMFNPGRFKVNALIVNPDSLTTGVFTRVVPDPSKKDSGPYVDFPNQNVSGPGELRKPVQPLWCRNTITPPPDPKTGPCTNTGTIGRVQLVGNLCPMNVRAISDENIAALDPDLRKVIENVVEAVNKRDADLEKLRPGYSPGFKFSPLVTRALPTEQARQVAATAINSAVSQAGIGAGSTTSAAEAEIEKAFNEAKGTTNDLKQFAMDQLYTAAGPLKVNGVEYDPQGLAADGKRLSTLVIPTDAGQAMNAVKQIGGMTLSSPAVDKALGSLDMSEAKPLKTVVQEAVNDPKKLLETIRPQDLAGRIDLGPFNFAKSAPIDIKMRDDGTAQVDATAEFPALFSPSGGTITTKITLTGDLQGRLELQKLRFKIDDAFLAVARVRGLDVYYNQGTLSINGELLFPGLDAGGIEIKNVVIGSDDRVRSFGITYTPPAGAGIPVGPAVFLTRLGGSFGTRPNQPNKDGEYIPARTGVTTEVGVSAIAPGLGGGCPTVGVDGNANVFWDPEPWEVTANGALRFLCIPIGKVGFGLWGNGKMTVLWDQTLDIAGIIEYGWKVFGALTTKPNAWMVKARGRGAILDILELGIEGVIGSKGAAFCARAPWPIPDPALAVNFPGGRIPGSFGEFIKNIDLFTGCNLRPWEVVDAPFRRGSRQAGSTNTFTIEKAVEHLPLRFQGAGDVPNVILTSPSGQVIDFNALDPTQIVDGKHFGAAVENGDRTVVFLDNPEPGTWTVATPPGSAPLLRVETTTMLPDVKVKGSVVRGAGPSRMLRYDARTIPGQVIDFVEIGGGPGIKRLKTIQGGGKGKFRFTVSEATGTKRRIEAQVTQDGTPRANLTIAEFSAPSPKVGKPKVRMKRRGSKVTATWRKAALAHKYDVQVATSDGEGRYVPRTAAQRTVVVDGVRKAETVRVSVVAISPAQRKGKAGVGVSKGAKKKKACAKKKGKARKRCKAKRKK